MWVLSTRVSAVYKLRLTTLTNVKVKGRGPKEMAASTTHVPISRRFWVFATYV